MNANERQIAERAAGASWSRLIGAIVDEAMPPVWGQRAA